MRASGRPHRRPSLHAGNVAPVIKGASFGAFAGVRTRPPRLPIWRARPHVCKKEQDIHHWCPKAAFSDRFGVRRHLPAGGDRASTAPLGGHTVFRLASDGRPWHEIGASGRADRWPSLHAGNVAPATTGASFGAFACVRTRRLQLPLWRARPPVCKKGQDIPHWYPKAAFCDRFGVRRHLPAGARWRGRGRAGRPQGREGPLAPPGMEEEQGQALGLAEAFPRNS